MSTVEGHDKQKRMGEYFHGLDETRDLWIMGEIDIMVANTVIAQILYLNAKDNVTPIYLHISSSGGDAIAALALVDAIRSVATPVYTFCIGICASAAAVVFSSGARGHRYIYKHSRIMIHGIRGSVSGSLGDVKVNYELMEELNREICEALSENTGISTLKITNDIQRDRWFTSILAVEYGLADKIVSKRSTQSTKKEL